MYDKLRKEFAKQSFRDMMKEQLGERCVNCGSTEHIEYHHIVPLKNGGTNNLTNIVPLCEECHYKAHDKTMMKSRNGGRPRVSYEKAEPILDRYFNEEIGMKEAKELIGIAPRSKGTWYRLVDEYKEAHRVDEYFKNKIDFQDYISRRNK